MNQTPSEGRPLYFSQSSTDRPENSSKTHSTDIMIRCSDKDLVARRTEISGLGSFTALYDKHKNRKRFIKSNWGTFESPDYKCSSLRYVSLRYRDDRSHWFCC